MSSKSNPRQQSQILLDSEWIALLNEVCAILQSGTQERMRYQVLQTVRKLIPYQSASFFLVNPKTNNLESCLLAQPVGVEIPSKEFERYTDTLRMKVGIKLDGTYSGPYIFLGQNSSLFHESDNVTLGSRFLEDYFMATCFFSYEQDVLGALVLARTPEQGGFLEKEQFILETISPHVAHRLKMMHSDREYGMFHKDSRLRVEYKLTKREVEVVHCVYYGMTIPEIATKLTISTRTVNKHLEKIYRKTGVNNRMSLVKFIQSFIDKN